MKLADLTLIQESSNRMVFRGIDMPYDDGKFRNSRVIWVSTDRKHAEQYSSDKGEVITYKLSGQINPLDLGFRVAETDVQAREVLSRIRQKLFYTSTSVPLQEMADDQIRLLVAEMKTVRGRVWELVQHPKILDIIELIGWNVIVQREGFYHQGVTTYGVIDKKLLKRMT